MLFEEQPWVLIPLIIAVVEGWNGFKSVVARWWRGRHEDPAVTR